MSTGQTTKTKRFKVGDRVRFQWGGNELEGMIVEDRGPLGIDGEQIVRVQAMFDVDLRRDAEVRASRLVETETTGNLIFENENYRIYLDYFSPAANYPQPGMRIERASGKSKGLSDFCPTDFVAANIISNLFGENHEMLACEVVIRIYKKCRKNWDNHTLYAAESFIGRDNVKNLNRHS